ncbi:L,D-transpeptidase family protein [Myceligenerans pegani]|uniref:L,D-transpeptidase n=1 Tax=Myceligenerans pegani TaxID=2776917 RepID=A0ABR9MSW9_9MICO|nr:L,D-transpeptidase [Myceligenerans sp. TRM 65318]MBE1874454.1 L,D-transpeptidase [Myceligenerans sp. TRM 65318]MBE3016725.1 L,D-transpeptidase [Myceligenerans sp. TRM 65318]
MNASVGPHDGGPPRHGSVPGSAGALSRGWMMALIGGVVALLLIAVTGTITMLRDDPTARWAAEAAPPSPTPTLSPSPRPSPTPAEFDLAALEVPTIESVLPQMPRSKVATLDDLPGKAAVPKGDRTPVWVEPDVSTKPRLALAATQYEYDARWLVLRTRDDWVQVLLPYGRGALPSSDPGAVNGVAGWVQREAVRVEEEDRSIVVDLSDRAVVVNGDGGQVTVPAGVGAPSTPTPQGVSQVMTVAVASNTGLSLFLSAQSETLDTFAGVNYAATALHVGVGQGQEISNGCVRLTPDGFDAVKDFPAGVPVVVRA